MEEPSHATATLATLIRANQSILHHADAHNSFKLHSSLRYFPSLVPLPPPNVYLFTPQQAQHINKSKPLIPEQKETSACWQHNASLFLFPKHFCHTFVALLYQPPGLEAAASISCHNDKQGKFSQGGAQHWTPRFLMCFSGAITISLPAWPSMPSLASCLPRMMLPQVAGSISVVSLGAKWRSVGRFAGEAAGVGVAVPYQMDRGSQKTMKALITKGGKNQKWHICNKLNISIYLYWILQAVLQACSLASRAADSLWRLPMSPCFFLPSFCPYS